jgi:hypothetical protein
MPVELRALIFLLLIPFAATPTEKPAASDMDLLEFLGSLETENASGTEVLTVIDTDLLPDSSEEPLYE